MNTSRYKLQAWLNQWEQSIRISKSKYRDAKKERAIIQEMYKRLHTVSRAVADDDLDTAVFSAVQFGLWAGEYGELIGHVERSRRGGEKAKYSKVHDKAEEVYKGDPDPGKPDAARFAIELAEAAPRRYGLEAGTKIPYDTIYRELLKRTKYS